MIIITLIYIYQDISQSNETFNSRYWTVRHLSGFLNLHIHAIKPSMHIICWKLRKTAAHLCCLEPSWMETMWRHATVSLFRVGSGNNLSLLSCTESVTLWRQEVLWGAFHDTYPEIQLPSGVENAFVLSDEYMWHSPSKWRLISLCCSFHNCLWTTGRCIKDR